MSAVADLHRLPRTAIPSRYDLVIEPDLDAASFTGSVSIAVETTDSVDELVLNALDLEIDEAWLEPAEGGSRTKATVTLEPETERARLALPTTIEPGRWVVQIEFRGGLNDKLTGFYRSTFTDGEGTERTIAVTQFEATHARQAFPCWDEPELKAVFGVTLVVDESLETVSNAAVLSDEPTDDGRHRVRFADTMVMSTYLVAWVVGPVEATQPVHIAGVPLRVVYPPGNEELTGFAVECASFALRFFADYYGIAYPGDKCDLVAVPDFAFGAMENLGCITFREALLLVDPNRSTQPELQRVADVINHELAHMWFGDLVTMKWWNGIWLNEAFATFMEMKCTEAFRPEWDRWTDFGLARTSAMEIDSLDSTRPIEFEVVSPRDAEGMFDVLTYEKGASVLRMLEQFLGEERFRTGVRHYLTSNAYANTETTDLWDAIEASTGEPVRQIMDSWIFQGGYPIVGFTLKGSTLELHQERFVFDAGSDVEQGGELWAVPVLFRYGRGDEAVTDRLLLRERSRAVELSFEPEWVQLNAGGSGFYRVAYDPAQFAALRPSLRALTALERYQLVDNAFASMLAGSRTAAEFLDLARHFADDDDLSVWQRIGSALGLLDRMIDDGARPSYQATVRALSAPALVRLGFTPSGGEDDRRRQLRATLFELVATTGADTELLTRARAIHADFWSDPDFVDPALAAAAVNVIAEHGTREDFEEFVKHSVDSDNPQIELRYLYALARFVDESCFGETLERSLTEMRAQDGPFVLARALMNRSNGPTAWHFIREHWGTINERFPSSTISRMAEGVKGLVDPAVAKDVQSFFAAHPVPQAGRTIEQHLERLRVNVALREREGAALAHHLSR